MGSSRKEKLNWGIVAPDPLERAFIWVGQTLDPDSDAQPSQRQLAEAKGELWGRGDEVARGKRIAVYAAAVTLSLATITAGVSYEIMQGTQAESSYGK